MNVSASVDQKLSHSAKQQKITVFGFGRRLAATLYDGLILAALTFALVATIGFVAVLYAGLNPYKDIQLNALFFWIGLILSLAYYVGFWVKRGQTIGKSLMGIKVVSKDGPTMTWRRAFLRYIGYLLSGLVFSLGFLWIALDRKRQGWHDKLAGTYVIDVEGEYSDAASVELVPSDPGRAWVWILVWLVIGLITPAGFLSGLWFLGPIINRIFGDIVQGLL